MTQTKAGEITKENYTLSVVGASRQCDKMASTLHSMANGTDGKEVVDRDK